MSRQPRRAATCRAGADGRPPRVPPPKRRASNGIDQRALAVVAGGVGVLGFATFAVFGVLDQKKYSDLQDKCPGGVCSGSVASGIDTGRTYQTLANVGLVVGLVGAAAGIVLFATAPSQHALPITARVPTEVAVGPSSMLVRGRF